MEPAGIPRRRAARLSVGVLAVVALLAVVTISTRGGFGHDGGTAAPSVTYVNYAYTLLLIVFAVLIPVAIRAFLLERREGLPPRQSFVRRVLRNIGYILFFALASLVYYTVRKHHGPWLRAHPSSSVSGSGHHHIGAGHTVTPTLQWPLVWLALAVLVVVAWWALARRRQKSAPTWALPAATDELRSTIDDAIDDLEREPDARRAVIAAYARMESVLARVGLPRTPSETQLEYLRRILLRFTARGDAVRRLTELFGRAKFSQHTIGVESKHEAIDALRAIRDGLPAQ